MARKEGFFSEKEAIGITELAFDFSTRFFAFFFSGNW